MTRSHAGDDDDDEEEEGGEGEEKEGENDVIGTKAMDSGVLTNRKVVRVSRLVWSERQLMR